MTEFADITSAIFEKHIKDYEDKVKQKIKDARSRGEICVECSDWMEWKIHGVDGYYVYLNNHDWQIIQRYIDEELYDKSSVVFLERMLDFVWEIMCKNCKQKCEKCAIKELKNAIERRLPPEED